MDETVILIPQDTQEQVGQKRPRNVFWDTFVFFEKKEYNTRSDRETKLYSREFTKLGSYRGTSCTRFYVGFWTQKAC